jgi:hypothetical protein
MRHQTITIAGAMVLSVVASGIAFAAPDNAAPAAAPECLSSPKSTAPAGSHWFYRTDRANKRKCWYLADASTKTVKTAAAKPSHPAPAKPVAAEKDASPSFGNARAEMETANAAPDDEKLQDSVWPAMPDKAATDVSQADTQIVGTQNSATLPLQTAQSAAPQDASSQQQPSADTNLSSTNPSSPQPAASPAPEFKPTLSDTSATPAAAAQPAVTQPAATTAPAQATAAAPADSSNSLMPTLFAALACALGLAAILGSIAMKIFDRRRAVRVPVDGRIRRREIWSGIATEAMPQRYPAAMPKPMDLDEAASSAPLEHDDPDQEIEQLLAKASNKASRPRAA